MMKQNAYIHYIKGGSHVPNVMDYFYFVWPILLYPHGSFCLSSSEVYH